MHAAHAPTPALAMAGVVRAIVISMAAVPAVRPVNLRILLNMVSLPRHLVGDGYPVYRVGNDATSEKVGLRTTHPRVTGILSAPGMSHQKCGLSNSVTKGTSTAINTGTSFLDG